MSIRAHVGLVLVWAIAAALVSCHGKGPTGPQRPDGGASAAAVSLRLTAPERINPGESAQLVAEAIKADGSAENVTSRALWISSEPATVRVSASGSATTTGRGESIVQVRHGDRVAEAHIFVTPADTFRLAGRITEGGVGVGGVEVQVLYGVGRSLVAVSRFDGSYAVYGVSGPVQIKLRKAGYLDASQDLELTVHQNRDFELRPERPIADYRGTYALTIRADPDCFQVQSVLPPAVRRREYTADVAQEGRRVTVTLTGAEFWMTGAQGRSFGGLIDSSNTLTFRITKPSSGYYDPWYYGPPDVAEMVGNMTLIVSGSVSVDGPPPLYGKLNAALLLSHRASYPFGPPYSASCIGRHDFAMVRR